MIDNVYFYYPWYTLFMSRIHGIHFFRYGIHDAQYLWLVFMIHNIDVGWSMIRILMSGIHDIQYLCPDQICDIMYCRFQNIKFIIIQLLNKRQHLSSGHGHVQKSVTKTRLWPNPWPDWTPCQIWSKSVKNCDPHAVTDTHTREPNYIYIYIYNTRFRKIMLGFVCISLN